MLSDYFYNQAVKKSVSVFGTVFNNISVGKRIGGKLTALSKVPLSYGPRARFIDRIKADPDATKLAIKVPRMSFQITSLSYDPTSKMNSVNRRTYPGGDGSAIVVPESVPYRVGFQLSIMSRNQDDALQILEQILPSFTPEYTVTVKGMIGPNVKTDVPIILTSVDLGDDFEGDLASSRRLVLYTLTFDVKIRLSTYDPFGTTGLKKYIKFVDVDLHASTDPTSDPIDHISVDLGDPENDTPDNYTVVTTFGFDEEEEAP